MRTKDLLMPLSWNKIRDRAVDTAYGKTGFKTETERVAFLFERYQQLTAPLAAIEKPARQKKAK
jgi:hypothetical protein